MGKDFSDDKKTAKKIKSNCILVLIGAVPDNRRPRWPKIRHSVKTKIFF